MKVFVCVDAVLHFLLHITGTVNHKIEASLSTHCFMLMSIPETTITLVVLVLRIIYQYIYIFLVVPIPVVSGHNLFIRIPWFIGEFM